MIKEFIGTEKVHVSDFDNIMYIQHNLKQGLNVFMAVVISFIYIYIFYHAQARSLM